MMRSAAVVVVLVLWCLQALADDKEFTGKVHRVRDGDTIVVIDQDRHHNEIRLSGIDAPEKGSKSKPGQPFGDRAREELTKRINGQEVRVVWRKYDRYKRIVGTVFLGDQDVNLLMVQEGMAWVFTDYIKELPEEARAAYLEAEAGAKAGGLGLWREELPEPPWEYRARLRAAKQEAVDVE